MIQHKMERFSSTKNATNYLKNINQKSNETFQTIEINERNACRSANNASDPNDFNAFKYSSASTLQRDKNEKYIIFRTTHTAR